MEQTTNTAATTLEQVNAMPAATWGWLKMNQTKLELSDELAAAPAETIEVEGLDEQFAGTSDAFGTAMYRAGIDVNTTISMTFAIGSALAAVAGVLFCSSYPNLMPTTGSLPGIKAFTAAVFGGIGSIPGALLGGILLGIIEIFAKAFNTNISDAVVFLVLIVVLLVKPTGLLGKVVREKV